MRSPIRGILKALGFALLAFFIVALTGGIWSALIVANIKLSPKLPWAIVAMSAVLWLEWQYLGGRWWPRSTSEARRAYLRSRRVPGNVFAWAVSAGALSIVALAGWWIVLFQLVRTPANSLGDYSQYPLVTVVAVLVMSSIVSPLCEEAGFRGYLQVSLERDFNGIVAILVSSIFFALVHLNHGAYWPKQLLYFLAGVVFGAIAFFTRSLWPGIVAHIIGDMTFFIFVWPHDAARHLVSEGGADAWFWIHAVQGVIFTALAIQAFAHLASLTAHIRTSAASRDLPASA